MIIYQDKIHPFEVKNYEGEYHHDPKGLKSPFGKIHQNPLVQLRRGELLLDQLQQNYGYHLPIEGYVVYVNPEFTLYNAPQNEPAIFPTQLNKFLKKFDMKPSKLYGWHRKLAETLDAQHQKESPLVPDYDYNGLRKGITCAACHSFAPTAFCRGKKLICGDCGHVEDLESAVLRCVGEIKLLFPNMKFTTNVVYEWCGGLVSKKTFNRILTKSFKRVGHGKFSYYIED